MTRINRRQFAAGLAALGLTAEGKGAAEPNKLKPEVLLLSRNGWMPNNEHLPALLYRGAFTASSPAPAVIFERNGWPPQWRNGVYTFHHYHSTAHEVLGFVAGHARIVLGGENGREITVTASDVAVLPTGTGHCELSRSGDFLVVGAYPPNQKWDICRTAPTPDAIERMLRLPFPQFDPVAGTSGPLIRYWRASV